MAVQYKNKITSACQTFESSEDMTSIFGLDNKEAVRISAKKCDGLKQPEYKKLCVDPQITSFAILRNLLTKAFQVKSDFTISYVAKDARGQDVYLSMLSDWDLDAAFFGSSDPVLKLKVDLKPFEDGLEDDWDMVSQSDESGKLNNANASTSIMQTQLFGMSLSSMSSKLQGHMTNMGKMMGISGVKSSETEQYQLGKQPMTDAEFHGYMDNVGHMVRQHEFRLSVYQGGVEPSLRKVVWRHLLNVYPEGLTGQERFDYMKQKCSEYYRLRDEWRISFLKNHSSEEIKSVTNMVKKDVLRTDRTHQFYAGSDENRNTGSLFNLLTTYALTHPDVSYCQGMSDLASPILFVQNDEAHAYVCFCGLMKRLRPNFALDGEAMTVMFQHLALLLRHHDPDFYGYLKEHKADDMFFCYRWLLLELKREFPFEQALIMLEIMWSSLLPDHPELELQLADPVYYSQGLGRVATSPTMVGNISAYMKLKRRRQHSIDDEQKSYENTKENVTQNKVQIPAETVSHSASAVSPREDDISGSSFSDFLTLTVADFDIPEFDSLGLETLESAEEYQTKNCGNGYRSDGNKAKVISYSGSSSSQNHSNSSKRDATISSQKLTQSKHDQDLKSRSNVRKGPGKAKKLAGDNVEMTGFVENHYEAEKVPAQVPDANDNDKSTSPLAQSPKRPSQLNVDTSISRQISDVSPRISSTGLVIEENGVTEKSIMNISSCEEAINGANPLSIGFVNVDEKLSPLPQPQTFGNGNPFLMFLCLALFSLHRDHIIKNRMDYNDMAMFFDKMVRKHKVNRVLHQAQSMYASYLKQQKQILKETQEDSNIDGFHC